MEGKSVKAFWERLLTVFRSHAHVKQTLSPIDAHTVGVLGSLQTPTMRYLIAPALGADGKQAREIIVELSGSIRDQIFKHHEVIIVRYFSRKWLRDLHDFRAAGGRIIYFMDDDLMDRDATVNLPSKYRKKIYNSATRHRHTLENLCNDFWVATPYLKNKYASWNARLLSPSASVSELEPSSAVSVCYHGTASHPLELDWLAPVMAGTLAETPFVRFEIFGDIVVNRMYRDAPRVSVIHPMSWHNYFSYTKSIRNDIALAPVLRDPFNAARGPTKFFDFVRMGSVGIYSNVEPYLGFIRDGVDGVLLPNDPEVWKAKIVELACNPIMRKQMFEAAKERALSMAWDIHLNDRKPNLE
jgi:hypothetical protein